MEPPEALASFPRQVEAPPKPAVQLEVNDQVLSWHGIVAYHGLQLVARTDLRSLVALPIEVQLIVVQQATAELLFHAAALS